MENASSVARAIAVRARAKVANTLQRIRLLLVPLVVERLQRARTGTGRQFPMPSGGRLSGALVFLLRQRLPPGYLPQALQRHPLNLRLPVAGAIDHVGRTMDDRRPLKAE